jgi:hypothetical protein
VTDKKLDITIDVQISVIIHVNDRPISYVIPRGNTDDDLKALAFESVDATTGGGPFGSRVYSANEKLQKYVKKVIVAGDIQLLENGAEIEKKYEQEETHSDFGSVLRDEYIKIVRTSPIAPYVLITQLRDFVCARLDIDRADFDRRTLERAMENPYNTQLSTSSGEKGTGIFYGRGECHAVIVK